MQLLTKYISDSLKDKAQKTFSENHINYMYMVSMASLNSLIWKNRSKKLQGTSCRNQLVLMIYNLPFF